jgi:drug/metabolite transporter superfamily protein YnfA
MSKANTYLISGIFLIYFGLKDENFVIWYNGVALILGITALIYAFIEHRKTKKDNKN